MPDDLIHCPACNFQLRLPHELYGTPVECPQCHARMVPHRVCPTCGFYAGRQVIEVKPREEPTA